MSNNSLTTTTRLRIKEPVYTSDKRAKFTQRESKKWIRFCTVIGYIFFVSLPATSLSIYYIWVWDPDYISRVTRQGSRSKYRLDLLRESNTSSRISKNLIRASVYPSFTKATGHLEQRPRKMDSSNTADQRLRMKPD
uniref:Transmembrane protein n=1 Tax=Wuchereria bancrofti TaxID=6293 RepID=A0AAF5RVT7_WUCBA